jgi:hypothetical protein
MFDRLASLSGLDWYNLLGTTASILGLVFAFRQIIKSKRRLRVVAAAIKARG